MLLFMRAERAIEVLTPPGWTVVALTPELVISSSWRRHSVKPRTANFAALYAERSGLCSGFLEPLLVDVGERELAVTACEIKSKRPPNAGARAGDRGHFVCEFLHT
jgi:hypothetical protein